MGIPAGVTGRQTLGLVILVHLIVYNETGGPTAVVSVILATGCAILSAICKSSLAHVQLPYLRATQKFDFFCLFLALWMDLLALMATCSALARTLSTCIDAMSGGMARIYLLGRNSPENEPWPDVLGVSIVFLLTVMFMLGLENTKVFNLLMTIGVMGISIILAMLCSLRGTADAWKSRPLLPLGTFGILTSAALASFSFPNTFSSHGGAYKRCLSILSVVVVGASVALTAACLSTITQYGEGDQLYIAVPILPLLEKQDFHTFQPAVSCLLVLACSGAYLELFPEMYGIIVQLTTIDWKVLPRQIGYESADSGSPVLAIFTGASLCAMLAFACPLQNLVYILAASHLSGSMMRALFLLYTPLRPKFMTTTNEVSLAYSRLDVSGGAPLKKTTQNASRSSSIWCFLKKPKSMSLLPTSKSMLKKSGRNEELEREWLLLGEPPQSPRVGSGLVGGHLETDAAVESTIHCGHIAVATLSDVECMSSPNNAEANGSNDSDSTTDIDAIVDEYRQKVKVSTAGPMEKIIRLPTVGSWHLTLVLLFLLFCALIAAAIGATQDIYALLVTGVIVVLVDCMAMVFLPKYAQGPTSASALTCGTALLLETLLLASTMSNSWPAIVFWVFSGLALFLRCDRWFCACLDYPRRPRHLLLPSVSANTTSIRIPCPPRGSIIPSRISGHR